MVQSVVLIYEVVQGSIKLLRSDFLISANATKFIEPSIMIPEEKKCHMNLSTWSVCNSF